VTTVKRVAVSAFFATCLLATAGQAQNGRLNPTNGTVTLQAGFMPDPYARSLRAGGENYMSGTLGCIGGGWFSNPPDYRVQYRAGRYPSLVFYVYAAGDTVLLISDPQARWHCNDDYSGRDPAVRISNPVSGQYDIWVGTYNRSRVERATLYISER